MNALDVELVDGLTRSRWGIESSVWDVRWGLFPGPAGADQGACVDGCRAGRRPGRLRALDRLIRYRSSLSLSISHWHLTTAFIRGPGDHVLAGRTGSDGSSSGLKRAKRIAAHTSFFKSGIWVGRTFVCVVKTSPLSSTIKIFEPIDQNIRGRNKPTFRKLLQGGNDTLRIYKEFYIPVPSSSIHFLRTKLCVACVNGFEIIDPDTFDTQGVLDPSDESLDFARRRSDNTRPKPAAIYCIENEFLLCYDGACRVVLSACATGMTCA